MRFKKIMVALILACQLTGVRATDHEVNGLLSLIIKKNTTELFKAIHTLSKIDKTLDHSDGIAALLVTAVLLQMPQLKSMLLYRAVDLNAPAIIDSCKLQIGLQTNETYELFCTTAFTPARSFIEFALTPLQATCLTGDLAAMKMLIKAGANIDGDPEVLSPLASCIATQKLKQANFLLDQGADIKVKNSPFSLLSLLSRASASDSYQTEAERLAEKIIAKGADPHYLTKEKYSELDTAAGSGNLAIVKVLVKHGVDINAKSAEGLTPLGLAEKNNHAAVVDFLISKGAQK